MPPKPKHKQKTVTTTTTKQSDRKRGRGTDKLGSLRLHESREPKWVSKKQKLWTFSMRGIHFPLKNKAGGKKKRGKLLW